LYGYTEKLVRQQAGEQYLIDQRQAVNWHFGSILTRICTGRRWLWRFFLNRRLP